MAMGSVPDDEKKVSLSIFTAFFPSPLPVADGSSAIYCHLLHNDDNNANTQWAHFTRSKTAEKAAEWSL